MVFQNTRLKYLPIMVFQLVLAVLFFVFVKYDGSEGANLRGFEDTHVMIFIGFAYLMTFLKKYGYSATGLNWFLAALVIQWAILCQGFFEMSDNTIKLTKKTILESDVMSATVLITFGALLGVASATQLLFIAIVEVVVGCCNFYLVGHVLKAADVGGSIAIHSFGAYFGLGVSAAMRVKKEAPHELNGPNYSSDITAMIGSIFLWIYWPSFNSALCVSDGEYQRAVVNSYLSLAAAAVVAFVMSSMVNHEAGKFDMVHVQNSTLAGGVAIGSVCNMLVSPGGAIIIGMGAGILSVLGYRYLTPKLENWGVTDTCGVNNLHGMPGIYSGLLSIVFAAIATKEHYAEQLGDIFGNNADGSSANVQAMHQLYALLVTLGVSIVGGVITGFIAKQAIFTSLKEEERYNDAPNWELPHQA